MSSIRPIVILGSTGSIGLQSLQVAKLHNIEVKALSAHSNAALLRKQLHDYGVSVENACLSSKTPEKLCRLAAIPGCTVINAIVGSAGLKPTVAAINAGNPVALANKETLVAGGELVMRLANEKGVPIIPVDSEHSAIMQCLNGESDNKIRKIILTASGGAFRDYTKQQLKSVTKEEALRHPNWDMGSKITVDSATLMNKGLELIEAMHLFNVKESQIEVVIHPQSIIHSAVEFADGSVIAQLGMPDMRIPIQYALTFPQRLKSDVKRLSLTEAGTLTFEQPRYDVFPCLSLARAAARLGGNAPCVLNAANEAAVEAFLADKIDFYQIPNVVSQAFTMVEKTKEISIEIIERTEANTRETVRVLT